MEKPSHQVIIELTTEKEAKMEVSSTTSEQEATQVDKELPDMMQKILAGLENPLQQGNVCIHNVPHTLRETNEAAYTPQVISIGPIHHGKQTLKDMEMQKARYFKEFCERYADWQGNWTVITKIIAGREEEIRRCYTETTHLDSEAFGTMVLLDTVFIIELLIRDYNESKYKDDVIIGKPWLRVAVQLDLILLENQLPYFILEEVYDNVIRSYRNTSPSTYVSFDQLTYDYFSNYKPMRSHKEYKPLHFTDLVRYFWSLDHPPAHKSVKTVYSATRLHRTGVEFKPVQNACLLDMRFTSRVTKTQHLARFIRMSYPWVAEFHIPCFEVDDTTERVVRNLMALEQCHYPYDAYICNYILVMNFLVSSAEDVDLLIGKRILINRLGDSDAVAKLVNRMCQHITVVNSCYYPLSMQLNDHYQTFVRHPVRRLLIAYVTIIRGNIGTLLVVSVVLLLFIMLRQP